MAITRNWLQNQVVVAHNVSFERCIKSPIRRISNKCQYIRIFMLIISFKKWLIRFNSYKLPNVYNAVFNKNLMAIIMHLMMPKLLLKL